MATFTVNTLSDVVNAGDGRTSLREAITAANASSTADTINFSARSGTLRLSSGLTISQPLTITGPGTGLVITGRSTFDVLTISRTTASISNLSVASGNDGIQLNDSTRTTLSNVITRNNADDGVDVEGSRNTLSATNVTFQANREDGMEVDGDNNAITVTSGVFTGNDQGLHVDAAGQTNRLTLNSSSFNSNLDDGLDFDGSSTTVAINRSQINSNADDGISIDNLSDRITISSTRFVTNRDFGIQFGPSSRTNTLSLRGNTFTGNRTGSIDSSQGTGNTITGDVPASAIELYANAIF